MHHWRCASNNPVSYDDAQLEEFLCCVSCCLRNCRARLACGLSLSQPDPGIEFLNSDVSPHKVHFPLLVGPFGLSIIQLGLQSGTVCC